MRSSACALGVALVAITVATSLAPTAFGARAGVPVLVAPSVAGPPHSIAAAGDSFNTGFAARPKTGDNPDLSWSVGDDTQVASIYQRLAALTPSRRPQRFVVALDGSKVADLPRQFARAAALHAQLVTVQSGGNDVCAARDPSGLTPEADFRRSIEAAFAVARARMPDARIFVTSLTDEARWNDRSLTIAGNESKLADGTLCDPDLDPSGAPSPLRRTQIQSAEQRYNAILRHVCAQNAHCRYDGGAFFRLVYEREDIAPANAFHPSIAGLRHLAATAWRAGFDYRDTTPPHVSASTSQTGSTLRIVLAATDAAGVAGIECRFGSRPYSACAGAVLLPNRARVTYRAVDRNGNSSAAYSITAP